MTPLRRRAAGALVAAGVTGAIVALSRAPYGRVADDAALLRLSWSGRPARIERCRERSDSELAKLPAHMRQRVECKGRSARYIVRVLDGEAVLARDTVTGGGLRGDRSIHMLREYLLAPGVHALTVEVARADSTSDEGEEAPEDEERPRATSLDRSELERDERRRQREERLPPVLHLDTTVRMPPGSVFLVTYDASDRRLVGVTGAGREADERRRRLEGRGR